MVRAMCDWRTGKPPWVERRGRHARAVPDGMSHCKCSQRRFARDFDATETASPEPAQVPLRNDALVRSAFCLNRQPTVMGTGAPVRRRQARPAPSELAAACMPDDGRRLFGDVLEPHGPARRITIRPVRMTPRATCLSA